MREILFRGKHIHALPPNEHLDGRWIYGYLSDENYINSPELEGEFLVDPETVCQYTGLTDKNGMKIFEGDVVKIPDDEDEVYTIEWDNDRAKFVILQTGSLMCDFDNYWGYEIEVIGNIFDNPELIGADKQG